VECEDTLVGVCDEQWLECACQTSCFVVCSDVEIRGTWYGAIKEYCTCTQLSDPVCCCGYVFAIFATILLKLLLYRVEIV
jgi:hypothetical protein